MPLFELPIPLLASIACYLESSSLVRLDSAACNNAARPLLLEAFILSSTAYDEYTYYNSRIAWLVRKRINISSITVGCDEYRRFCENGDLTGFWSRFTSESIVQIHVSSDTLFPSHFRQLLQSAQC